MPDVVVLCVALAICTLPGLSVLLSLGIRRALPLTALAAPVSAAVAALCATVAALIGIDFGVETLSLVTTVASLVGVAWFVIDRRRCAGQAAFPPRTGRTRRTVTAAGGVLVAGGCGLGVATWLSALNGISTFPQEHDTIVHTLLTSYISRTGRGAPWQVLPLDVASGEPVTFYPAGIHLLAAATTDVTGNAVSSLNAVTVVLLAMVLSISAAVLTVVAAGRLRLSAAVARLAGGFASLAAAGLYRPTFQLAHDGGALPNAAALAMTPAIIAGLLLLPSLPRRAAVGVALACAGAVWVHPSAAVSIGVTALAWWLGDMITRNGRRELPRLMGRLLIVGGVAATLLVPFVLSSATSVATTGSFPADTPPAGLSNAVGATLGIAYGGYLDGARATGQLWAAVLVAAGVAAVLMIRRGYGPLTAWGIWIAISIAYFLSPSTGLETVVTSFFYKAMVRVWSHTSLVAPVLIGLGIAVSAARAAVLLRRRVGLNFSVRPALLAAVLVVLAFVGYALGPGQSYMETNTAALASRYGKPAFVRVGPDDRAAANWLAERVTRGQRVLNSPNDGSTILYVEYGIPIVNVTTLGLASIPYTYRLLQSFNHFPQDPEIRRMLKELNVAWVYVDSAAPTIGSAGSPENWTGGDLFSFPPGLEDLHGVPGVTEEFRSGSVSIYTVDLGQPPSRQ